MIDQLRQAAANAVSSWPRETLQTLHRHHHRLALLLAPTATDRPPNTTRTPAIGMPISRLTTTTDNSRFKRLGIHLIDQLRQATAPFASSRTRAPLQPLT
jgi:hypothetical protein